MHKTKAESDDSTMLRALDVLAPGTKAARVRVCMPVIERNLASGVRMAEILAVLKAHGLDISEITLKTYVRRFRKQARKSDMAASSEAVAPGAAKDSRAMVAAAPALPASACAVQLPAARPAVAVGAPAAVPGVVLLDELARVMQPDPAQQAERLQYYERLAREGRKGNPV